MGHRACFRPQNLRAKYLNVVYPVFNKTAFLSFSVCPTILSKHHLLWTVLWKHIEKTRKAFMFLKQPTSNRPNRFFYYKFAIRAFPDRFTVTLIDCVTKKWATTFSTQAHVSLEFCASTGLAIQKTPSGIEAQFYETQWRTIIVPCQMIFHIVNLMLKLKSLYVFSELSFKIISASSCRFRKYYFVYAWHSCWYSHMWKYFWLYIVYILICCLQISLVFRFLLTLVSSIPQTNQQAHVALIPIVFKQRLSSLQTMVTTKMIDKTSNPDPSTYHPTSVLKRFYIWTTKRKRNILGLN